MNVPFRPHQLHSGLGPLQPRYRIRSLHSSDGRQMFVLYTKAQKGEIWQKQAP